MPAKSGEVLIFERHIWAEKDGSINAVAWSRTNQRDAQKRFVVTRQTHLLHSTDLGKTWTHLAHVGLGRLLYMHDGQISGTLARINSLYIDVERVTP